MTFDDGWQALADKGAEIMWSGRVRHSCHTPCRPLERGRHRYFIVSSCLAEQRDDLRARRA